MVIWRTASTLRHVPSDCRRSGRISHVASAFWARRTGFFTSPRSRSPGPKAYSSMTSTATNISTPITTLYRWVIRIRALSRRSRSSLKSLCTHTRYMQEPLLDYAEVLIGTFGGELGRTGCAMFTCTGSEANDLALRVARYLTGKTGIIVTAEAYHGNSGAVAAISPSLGKKSTLDPYLRTVAAPGLLPLACRRNRQEDGGRCCTPDRRYRTSRRRPRRFHRRTRLSLPMDCMSTL